MIESRETLTHRLILPGDSNHHGTLYAGALLRIALEAGYATAYRIVGNGANLVLRRVLNLDCNDPVPVGRVIEIRGRALHLTRVYLVIGLVGTPLEGDRGPWMEGLMGFVQVSDEGRPSPLPDHISTNEPVEPIWHNLQRRLDKLLQIR